MKTTTWNIILNVLTLFFLAAFIWWVWDYRYHTWPQFKEVPIGTLTCYQVMQIFSLPLVSAFFWAALLLRTLYPR